LTGVLASEVYSFSPQAAKLVLAYSTDPFKQTTDTRKSYIKNHHYGCILCWIHISVLSSGSQ